MITENIFEITATPRAKTGKRESRRLRRETQLPAVVYGGGKETVSLVLDHHKIAKTLKNESVYSKILTLKINDVPEFVVLKAIDRHPFRAMISHIDFQRVRADEKLHMHIPIHFLGGEKAPGVKDGGGIVSHIMSDIEVVCLPADLPAFIELDISEMALNQIKHLSDLKLPTGVESVDLLHGNDKAVVSVHVPRVETPAPEEELAAPVSAEVPAMAQKSPEELAAKDAAKKAASEKKKS